MYASEIEKFKRYEKVKHMLQALPNAELTKNIRESDDLARVSFNAALERYIQGSSDCVFHAAFSVEMALILRLDKTLTKDEKENVRNKNGLMLSGAIDFASKRGILRVDKKFRRHGPQNSGELTGNELLSKGFLADLRL